MHSQTYVLGPSERDSGNALNLLQAELEDGLACLLLVSRVHGDRCASGDVGIASLGSRAAVIAVVVGVVMSMVMRVVVRVVVTLVVVGQLLDACAGHIVQVSAIGKVRQLRMR